MFRPAVVLLLGVAAWGQESRGTIAGVVTDAQAAGIPKVRVVITNLDTGVDAALETNDRGAYSAPLLLPGSYRIAAEREGFKKFTRQGIALSVNDNLRVDIQLELGAVSQSVTVTDAAPLVESAGGNMGMLVSNKEVTELPVAHGNPYALIALAPGTTFEGDPLLNRPYEPTNIVGYSMGGAEANTTDITLDGVSNTSRGAAGKIAAGYVPPADAIGEVRIETNSFDARAGQTSGGLVNISLRSGTNRIRGNGTFTKMKPQWMANTWFANRGGFERGDFDYNRWSGSLSGPIVLPKIYNGRSRTFFMWAYEQLTDQRPRGGATLTVPTAAQYRGDFSELLAIGANYQIYDPATRRRETGSNTRYREDPFPGNIIPLNRVDPVAAKVMKFFPLPLSDGTTVDHRYNYPKPNSPEIADYFTHTLRVDHNFSASNRLYVRGNGYVRNTRRNDYFETRATGLREQYHPIGGSIDDVYSLSPNLVLNLRYGYTRFTRQTDPLHGRYFDLTSLGFPKSFTSLISPDNSEFPAFEFNGYFNTVRTGEARFMDTHSLVAAFTRLKGSHNLDFGFEARAYRQNQYTGDTSRSGRYVFDQVWTRGPLDNSPVSPLGQGWAAFLLGLPGNSSNNVVSRPADFAEQSTVWCGYFQDSWRVRRNFTVNVGLRYELEGPLTERYNRSIRDFDPDAVLPIEAAAKAAYAAIYATNPTPELPPEKFRVRGGLTFPDGKTGRGLWDRDTNNLAPRFSLAWGVRQIGVVRAGYGIYFGPLGMRRGDVRQYGYSRNTRFVPTKDSGLSFYSTLSNPYPDGILEPEGKAAGSMTEVGNGITYFNPHPMASYNQRWQVSIQRQFRANNMIEVAYVGNRSTKLEASRDLNVVGNQMLSRSPVYDAERVNYISANVPNPFRNIPGVNGATGTNNNMSREDLLKPFPHFDTLNTTTYQGYSWYHSLQVRAARRVSTSLGVNGSFTWSRNMAATSFLNPADDLPYRSLASYDRPFRITASVMYQLPFGRRRFFLRRAPKWADMVIGGWQLSTIYIFQSGQPLAWGDAIYYGDPGNIPLANPTVERWFNTAYFETRSAVRPSYHYRTWPLYFANLRRDAMNNYDLSINKRWRLNERGMELQARGEALNALNRPQFAAPQMDQFNSAFGQITATANYPRQIQAVLRFSF
ncbi:MAG: carboxypeptidase regulatory-like domain-containing protein [Bryobacteraceae bacterium]